MTVGESDWELRKNLADNNQKEYKSYSLKVLLILISDYLFFSFLFDSTQKLKNKISHFRKSYNCGIQIF